MSLALLCSHIHKSPKHIALRNQLLPTADCNYSFTTAGGALVSLSMRDIDTDAVNLSQAANVWKHYLLLL